MIMPLTCLFLVDPGESIEVYRKAFIEFLMKTFLCFTVNIVISPNRTTFPKASEQAPKPATLCEHNTTLRGVDLLCCSIQGDPCSHPPVGIIPEQAVSSEQHQLSD